MGLMLGASVLTLLELFDMIVYNGVIKCIANYQEKKNKKRKQNAVARVNNGFNGNKNHVMPL